MRVLIVEDEKRLSALIRRSLKEAQYVTDLAENGNDALFMAESTPYDLIVLDIMIPGRDGLDVCRKLRKDGFDTPVLILTARDDIQDKVIGLDAGADDYLTKPFSFPEFLARVRALLRRKRFGKTTRMAVADLELDQVTHRAFRAGAPIDLTSTEYGLLEYLMAHRGQVVTRTMISEHVWNDNYDAFSNVINVYMNYLRKKVDSGHPRKLIHSLRGVGYCLKDE